MLHTMRHRTGWDWAMINTMNMNTHITLQVSRVLFGNNKNTVAHVSSLWTRKRQISSSTTKYKYVWANILFIESCSPCNQFDVPTARTHSKLNKKKMKNKKRKVNSQPVIWVLIVLCHQNEYIFSEVWALLKINS